MMVFLGSRLEEIADDFVEVMATAGRNQGTLLAGVLVGIGGWDSEPGSTSMKVLRRELDMLVTVRKATSPATSSKSSRRNKDAVPGKLFQLPTPGA
ncbi:hypothetical protein [Arthrobacter crystallopoietes]|uniref:hypothetical protein n=1 Tax=Crystallibacter crystallopoietes TaxID=37928 RepID=UPI00111468A5|nr:hypothetical protein [Arthrobacter crystallopoietes]